MATDLALRMMAKWRGFLVFTLLNAVTDVVTGIIRLETTDPRLHLFARGVAVVTALYCLINTALLLFCDREGDEGWPPLWE
ncbi:MAG: hypothetical protein ACOY93_18180 [Bacillota bacterium]